MNNRPTWVRNIRQLRKGNSYTCRHMAEQLLISPQRYSLIEKGSVDLTVPELVDVAAILEVTPAELLAE